MTAAAAADRVPGGAPAAPVRLMIVDDSQVARAVLARMISAHPDLEVVASAATAEEALAGLETTDVDVVVLDLEMPGGSGLAALPRIVGQGRGAKVLIVSSFCDRAVEDAVRALPSGAADLLAKPGAGFAGGRFSEVLAERLRRMVRPESAAPVVEPSPAPSAVRTGRNALGCVALGASTGGLNALTELLRALPPAIGAPVLVTQHLPALFVPFFARQLESACARVVRVAEHGAEPAADEILLAPGDAHLSLERKGGRVRVCLDRQPSASGCLPSVDVMLGAAAEIYGPSALGVVLSGIGRDGLAGSRRLVERGGTILVQDRSSAAVWGMPRVVAEAGLAAAVLPPSEIAGLIARRVEAGAWK